ncbi:hypothetical protein AVEN_43523-1 [Araneus ventricosus]|uniref:Uncharacterized protein n=1 Tax=Araneus ventricosus TaxID=182803 RepID=A0A4Y2J8T5_ARAVE|nr:hypothetical protein AVEN_43523-1 [Araneus ventricosus]
MPNIRRIFSGAGPIHGGSVEQAQYTAFFSGTGPIHGFLQWNRSNTWRIFSATGPIHGRSSVEHGFEPGTIPLGHRGSSQSSNHRCRTVNI